MEDLSRSTPVQEVVTSYTHFLARINLIRQSTKLAAYRVAVATLTSCFIKKTLRVGRQGNKVNEALGRCSRVTSRELKDPGIQHNVALILVVR